MKKRKLIDLPKQTMDMLARCAATLKPPPELTLSEWADRYRVLSAESSAEPGTVAHRQGSVPAGDHGRHRRPAYPQGGHHERGPDRKDGCPLSSNPLGYYMDYAPAPILVMQPTLDMGQTFSKDRLAPMIRDTPELRDKVDVKMPVQRKPPS